MTSGAALESALAKLRTQAAAPNWPVPAHITSQEAAALLARLEALEWRPIETAPKDGSPMLVCSRAGHVGRATYDAEEGCFQDEHTEFIETHWLSAWMPLPPAYRNPQPAAEGEKPCPNPVLAACAKGRYGCVSSILTRTGNSAAAALVDRASVIQRPATRRDLRSSTTPTETTGNERADAKSVARPAPHRLGSVPEVRRRLPGEWCRLSRIFSLLRPYHRETKGD